MLNRDENLDFACENMAKLLTENLNLMDSYTRDKYLPGVKKFCAKYRPVVAAFNQYCTEHEAAAPDAARECADAFLAGAAEMIAKKAEGKKEFTASMDMQLYRQILAAFVIPGIGAMQFPYGQLLIDAIREGWNAAYPKYTFLQADVETLNQGFRIRMGCYITTAVCESFGKTDSCYELMAFRSFRDGYLREQPDGEVMIQEYYRTAPEIVKAIDARPDATLIYRDIWDQYLVKCLAQIEAGEYEACTEGYCRMVDELKKAWL